MRRRGRAGGVSQTTLGYTGQRRDRTGPLYYHARYYDPALGRFASADSLVPDPADPQALNRYAYARNNPLRYTDPAGHWFWNIVAAATQAVAQDFASADSRWGC